MHDHELHIYDLFHPNIAIGVAQTVTPRTGEIHAQNNMPYGERIFYHPPVTGADVHARQCMY